MASQSLVINQREATWDGGLLVLCWALNPGSILQWFGVLSRDSSESLFSFNDYTGTTVCLKTISAKTAGCFLLAVTKA